VKPNSRVLHLAWESDYDGILHMFAGPDEPDRFDWQVIEVGRPHGSQEPGVWVRELVEVESTKDSGAFYGNRFLRSDYSKHFTRSEGLSVGERDQPEAFWMVDPFMGGYVEIVVPGIEGEFVAPVGSETAELGEVPLRP